MRLLDQLVRQEVEPPPPRDRHRLGVVEVKGNGANDGNHHHRLGVARPPGRGEPAREYVGHERAGISEPLVGIAGPLESGLGQEARADGRA